MDEDELINLTATDLSNQEALGWFQGRMEFGPRALGGRSILADPRSEKMQKELNLKIKFRESFRPFAPSVLREDVNDWFESLLKREVFAKETKIPGIVRFISYIFYVVQKYSGWSIKRQLVG